MIVCITIHINVNTKNSLDIDIMKINNNVAMLCPDHVWRDITGTRRVSSALVLLSESSELATVD